MPNAEGTKQLIVDEETHETIKQMAKKRRMSIKWYVEYLAELDIEIYEEEKVSRPTPRKKR